MTAFVPDAEIDESFNVFCKFFKLEEGTTATLEFSTFMGNSMASLIARKLRNPYCRYGISDTTARKVHMLRGPHAVTVLTAYQIKRSGRIDKCQNDLVRIWHFLIISAYHPFKLWQWVAGWH